jgi:hypothetical protein
MVLAQISSGPKPARTGIANHDATQSKKVDEL